MAGRREKFTPQEIIEGLEKGDGFLTDSAKHIGCTPKTLMRYINKYPECREQYEIKREVLVDLAENGLKDLLEQRVPSAIYFTLKTVGKHLGYVERHVVDKNITVNVQQAIESAANEFEHLVNSRIDTITVEDVDAKALPGGDGGTEV